MLSVSRARALRIGELISGETGQAFGPSACPHQRLTPVVAPRSHFNVFPKDP